MTKLQNGTNSMVNFTARDICAIIKACTQHKVSSLRVGDLEINMTPAPAESEYEEMDFSHVAAPAPIVELTEEQRKEIAYAERQEMLAMNPVAFEQSIVDESEASLYEDTYDQEY